MMNLQFAWVLLAAIPTASETISVRSAEHYRWGGCCDGWYLVKNDRLTVIQEKMPVGSSETRHLHRKAQQFFYVLKGEGTIEVKGQVLVLRQGEGVLVAPGTAHRVRSRSSRELLLQVTSEPPSHGDRVEVPGG